MPENLYCKGQVTLSEEGKENWDKIEWDMNEQVQNLGRELGVAAAQTVEKIMERHFNEIHTLI